LTFWHISLSGIKLIYGKNPMAVHLNKPTALLENRFSPIASGLCPHKGLASFDINPPTNQSPAFRHKTSYQ
jgi:hypothetical protein